MFNKLTNRKREGNQCYVQVEWDSGEIAWQPIKLITECDPHTLAEYTHEKNITQLNDWELTKKKIHKKSSTLHQIHKSDECNNANHKEKVQIWSGSTKHS